MSHEIFVDVSPKKINKKVACRLRHKAAKKRADKVKRASGGDSTCLPSYANINVPARRNINQTDRLAYRHRRDGLELRLSSKYPDIPFLHVRPNGQINHLKDEIAASSTCDSPVAEKTKQDAHWSIKGEAATDTQDGCSAAHAKCETESITTKQPINGAVEAESITTKQPINGAVEAFIESVELKLAESLRKRQMKAEMEPRIRRLRNLSDASVKSITNYAETRRPAPDKRSWMDFNKHEDMIKGPLTEDEKLTLRLNVEQYFNAKGWSWTEGCTHLFPHFFTGLRSRNGVWSEIAICLPRRSMLCLRSFAFNNYVSWKKGAWTKNEETTLFQIMKPATRSRSKKLPYEDIAKLLMRSPASVRAKWRDVEPLLQRKRVVRKALKKKMLDDNTTAKSEIEKDDELVDGEIVLDDITLDESDSTDITTANVDKEDTGDDENANVKSNTSTSLDHLFLSLRHSVSSGPIPRSHRQQHAKHEKHFRSHTLIMDQIHEDILRHIRRVTGVYAPYKNIPWTSIRAKFPFLTEAAIRTYYSRRIFPMIFLHAWKHVFNETSAETWKKDKSHKSLDNLWIRDGKTEEILYTCDIPQEKEMPHRLVLTREIFRFTRRCLREGVAKDLSQIPLRKAVPFWAGDEFSKEPKRILKKFTPVELQDASLLDKVEFLCARMRCDEKEYKDHKKLARVLEFMDKSNDVEEIKGMILPVSITPDLRDKFSKKEKRKKQQMKKGRVIKKTEAAALAAGAKSTAIIEKSDSGNPEMSYLDYSLISAFGLDPDMLNKTAVN